MIRPLLKGTTLSVVLVILLVPAAVYLTSPWWAPAACRLVAARFWRADIRPATATVNPFSLRLDGAGGTFQSAAGESYRISGDFSRFSVEVDALAFLAHRRVRSVSLELATLTVVAAEGKRVLPLSRLLPGGTPLVRPASQETPLGSKWTFDLLRLSIDKGVLKYSEGGRRGEISMDINFDATYRNVTDFKALANRILNDLLAKAAYGVLSERLFR